MAKAIESIYRDLEYARSIIKFSRERQEPEETDADWDMARKIGAEATAQGLSEDWSIVEEGHVEVTKDTSGGLSAFKRLSGFTSTLHTSRAKSRERNPL